MVGERREKRMSEWSDRMCHGMMKYMRVGGCEIK